LYSGWPVGQFDWPVGQFDWPVDPTIKFYPVSWVWLVWVMFKFDQVKQLGVIFNSYIKTIKLYYEINFVINIANNSN
jgi:hypothetical protein